MEFHLPITDRILQFCLVATIKVDGGLSEKIFIIFASSFFFSISSFFLHRHPLLHHDHDHDHQPQSATAKLTLVKQINKFNKEVYRNTTTHGSKTPSPPPTFNLQHKQTWSDPPLTPSDQAHRSFSPGRSSTNMFSSSVEDLSQLDVSFSCALHADPEKGGNKDIIQID